MRTLPTSPHRDAHADALQPAIDCFLATITDISECLEASGAELAAPHLEQMARIRKRLAFEPSVRALEEGRDALHNELASYAEKARSRHGCSDDLTQILIVLAQAGDAFALRKDGYADQFRHFTRLIGQVEQVEDPAAIREKLRTQIDRLRDFVESVYQENERTFAQMREQIEDYRFHLHSSASPDSADPLTGLPGATEFEKQLGIRAASGREFCLLKFRLHDAAGVEQRFGASARDEILKLLGTALACQVRARDFVSRWSAEEFLVAMECDSRTGQTRASQIAQWLSGNYSVETGGNHFMIDIQLTVKVIERAPDEAAESLLLRARNR
jgi:diguanylate cyclase (GGDEF)-like protein